MATIASEQTDGVLTITLNRPDVLNSFNDEMAAAMHDALREAAENSAVRAVLLTGAGRAFCAGQDLATIPNEPGQDFDIGAIVRRQYNPIIRGIRELEKPVICAVNGVAAGAGANIAFACDIVLAAREASFIQAFCKIGLIPDSSGTFFLPRLAGL
ncbi:MAG: enoyl-CoA hydratase-related protein, partial [Gemmatimonadota bacterium]